MPTMTPGYFGLPTTEGKTARGASSPANPALTMPAEVEDAEREEEEEEEEEEKGKKILLEREEGASRRCPPAAFGADFRILHSRLV